MCAPTIEQDGFFEGIYNYDRGLRLARTPAELARVLPRVGRISLIHARPVLFGFHKAVERRMGSLSLPFRQTNEIVGIAKQYTHDRANAPESGVPDAYTINYFRLGRFRNADIQKRLTIYVMRASLAAELQEGELADEQTLRRWQEVARTGQQFGNAILACSQETASEKSLITGTSSRNFTPLAAADEGLAGAAFETIAYWES